MTTNSRVTQSAGQLPHVRWLDLKGQGLMVECAIMKEDEQGNIYYFELGNLDNIDKQRVGRLLRSRNATTMQLWDLMSNTTLNNGVNALTYFHQLVKVISADGVIYTPKGGVVGTGRVQHSDVQAAAAAPAGTTVQS